MNILFLTDGITPYNTGGMQKHSYVMAKLLAKNNIDVTLVHCGFFNTSEFKEDYNQIFTASELKKITPLFVPFISNGKLPGHYITENKIYSKLIKEEIGKSLGQFDLIYAQGFTGWSFLNNSSNIPIYVNLHGFEMYQKAPSFKVKLEHYLLRPTVKTLVTKANFVLSFGGKLDSILKDLNVPNQKIIQQSNGIESNWITTKELKNNKVRILTFIGRYERRKGIEELTEALKQLATENIDFIFNFIGPIPEGNQFKHQKVNYIGEVKDAEIIKDHLDNSDFLISPSYAEGMPTVILEAMARGNAIIATDVGANSRMTKGNGILIDHTINSIKDGITKAVLLDDKELLIMKRDSLKMVETNFIWEHVIKETLNSIKRL